MLKNLDALCYVLPNVLYGKCAVLLHIASVGCVDFRCLRACSNLIKQALFVIDSGSKYSSIAGGVICASNILLYLKAVFTAAH